MKFHIVATHDLKEDVFEWGEALFKGYLETDIGFVFARGNIAYKRFEASLKF